MKYWGCSACWHKCINKALLNSPEGTQQITVCSLNRKMTCEHYNSCFARAKGEHNACMLSGIRMQNTTVTVTLHKPTTPVTDGAAFREKVGLADWLKRKKCEQKGDRCAALFFAQLCRSNIKMFKLKATALFCVFFFSLFFCRFLCH